ncbi:MAG TPA: four helix bundle protein [Gemmatimonadales bacterium]|nr:four helix bundle protein [Gemmatimonadales bacterium]
MPPIRGHRDLLIWQRGMDLADRLDKVAEGFPRVERFKLADQLSRAGRSVPTNISEGHGRYTDGEMYRYLGFSSGSLSEVDTHLELARRRGYLTEAQVEPLLKEVSELGRMIRAFRNSLSRTPTDRSRPPDK